MGFISELIGYPLGFIMWLVYRLFKNYGVAIFLFTVVVRIILFPLSVKQQKSTAAMAAFTPKLEKLKKQYANNPNKLQEEQMKLYAEEDINPMASCLPMALQLVFLYGIFDVVYRPLTHILRITKADVTALTEAAAPLFEGNNYFKARPELYIMQAVKDPANAELFRGAGISGDIINSITEFNNRLFGIVDLGTIPKTVLGGDTVWSGAAIGLVLIPIISGVIQLIMTLYTMNNQKKLNPDSAAQMGGMNLMFYIMPLFSVYIAFSYPAGIGYYWICSSIVGFAQSVILNKVYTPEYVAKLVEKDKLKKKNSKRTSFMQKYNEMYQEQLRAQNGGSQSAQSDSKIAAAGVIKDDDDDSDGEVKLSKSQMKEYERKIIAEARRRQAEKYGDEYTDSDGDD